MAKSRSEINNAYAKKAYDSLRIIVPKGRKADIQNHAEINGKSLNAYINDLVCADMEISPDEWKHKQHDEALAWIIPWALHHFRITANFSHPPVR